MGRLSWEDSRPELPAERLSSTDPPNAFFLDCEGKCVIMGRDEKRFMDKI